MQFHLQYLIFKETTSFDDFHIINQPMMVGNPLKGLNGEWTVDLCSCFGDVSRCAVSDQIDCYTYWCCFGVSFKWSVE